ncbi:hypothetical protein [Chryseobacterium indoltheticum]|uniref:hypothetical protein n=1 Tax=Chryseobacterium indoltheticum TaxID=254 RepID=UPI003F491611
MIADPDVTTTMFLKDTRTIPSETLRITEVEKADLGFVGSCMVHKGDLKIVSQMLRNLEQKNGKVEFVLHW